MPPSNHRNHHPHHHHHHSRLGALWVAIGSFVFLHILTSSRSRSRSSNTIMSHHFETVGMIPKQYFDQERVIYGLTERVLDGDTIRVRHIPNYLLKRHLLARFSPAVATRMLTPLSLTQRGIAKDTLSIRLYAIDCPEVSKRRDAPSQPFALQAKEFTTQLCLHQIVKVTLLRRDQYQRAVAKVQVKKVDVAMELAAAGLAELYMGGGAEYHHQYDAFQRTIQQAQRQRRGIWSQPRSADIYESAADYKKRQRESQQHRGQHRERESQPLREQPSKTNTHRRVVHGHVAAAATTGTATLHHRSTVSSRYRHRPPHDRPKLSTRQRPWPRQDTTLGWTPTTSTTSSTTGVSTMDHHTHGRRRRRATLLDMAVTGLEITG